MSGGAGRYVRPWPSIMVKKKSGKYSSLTARTSRLAGFLLIARFLKECGLWPVGRRGWSFSYAGGAVKVEVSRRRLGLLRSPRQVPRRPLVSLVRRRRLRRRERGPRPCDPGRHTRRRERGPRPVGLKIQAAMACAAVASCSRFYKKACLFSGIDGILQIQVLY
jgi:hypothetical protein